MLPYCSVLKTGRERKVTARSASDGKRRSPIGMSAATDLQAKLVAKQGEDRGPVEGV